MVCGHRNIPLCVVRTCVSTATMSPQLMIPKEELPLGLWLDEDQCMSGEERSDIVKKVFAVHKYLVLLCVTNGNE